jgi:mono/diheme cytochrome c family protein
VLVLGFMAFATSEFLREATRKPYTVTRVVYGSGILTSELEATRERGILGAGVWTSAYAARRYPSLVENGRVVPARALALDAESRRDLGRTLFLHHCNDCHAIRGYAGITGLIRGWAPDMIEDLIGRPDRYHYFMPPWSGSEAEILLLRDYLVSIAPPHPMGAQ